MQGQGWGLGRAKWVKGIERYKLRVIREIIPGDVTYGTANVINNALVYA